LIRISGDVDYMTFSNRGHSTSKVTITFNSTKSIKSIIMLLMLFVVSVFLSQKKRQTGREKTLVDACWLKPGVKRPKLCCCCCCRPMVPGCDTITHYSSHHYNLANIQRL